MADSGFASMAHILPILDWVSGYRRDWLLPDALAGVALWAVMVPEGMAYAGIVGVPIMGLYTIVPALLDYALLATSAQLVVGPDTATGPPRCRIVYQSMALTLGRRPKRPYLLSLRW